MLRSLSITDEVEETAMRPWIASAMSGWGSRSPDGVGGSISQEGVARRFSLVLRRCVTVGSGGIVGLRPVVSGGRAARAKKKKVAALFCLDMKIEISKVRRRRFIAGKGWSTTMLLRRGDDEV